MQRKPNPSVAKKVIWSIRRHLPFPVDEIVECTEVTEYSYINFVFRLRVRSGRRIIAIYLKCAYTYLAADLRPPFHFSHIKYPVQRIEGEIRALKLLNNVWGPDIVPSVLYSDVKKGIMVLSDVGRGGALLVKEFGRNRVHSEIAAVLGVLMGKLHGSTYGRSVAWSTVARWRKENTGYIFGHIAGAMERYCGKKALHNFIVSAQSAPQSLTWTDPIHRNMFVRPHGVVQCIDFDVMQTFDPAYDLGLITAHWKWMELKGIVAVRSDARKFLKNFFRSYQKQLLKYSVPLKDQKTIIDRAHRWMGIYLVYRADHKVNRFFGSDAQWEQRVREEGIRCFQNVPSL